MRLPLLWAASAAASDWSLSEGIAGHCFNQYYIISSPASIPMFIMFVNRVFFFNDVNVLA